MLPLCDESSPPSEGHGLEEIVLTNMEGVVKSPYHSGYVYV